MPNPTTTIETRSSSDIIQSWIAQACLEGRQDPYPGKRKARRIEWHVPVLLQIRPGEADAKTHYAQAIGIGLNGIGVRSPEAVEERTLVRVFVNDGEESVFGVIKHCSTTVGAHVLGIQFLPDR